MIELNEKDKAIFFRCATCGALRGTDEKKMQLCAGHKQRHAYRATLWEWLMIKIGLLK